MKPCGVNGSQPRFTSVEVCAGAGGQALGLEQAGFTPAVLVEKAHAACQTLRTNRPDWRVVETDLLDWTPDSDAVGVDLLAGGVPCPPFSRAGVRGGPRDQRNLFDRFCDLADLLRPKAVMAENVPGLLDRQFYDYRLRITNRLAHLGYISSWRSLDAAEFGVSQHRRRTFLVGLRRPYATNFTWPVPLPQRPPTVGQALADLMGADGWKHAEAWAQQAGGVAPTLVGGSDRHGGADLGPTGSRTAWAKLGVDGAGIADNPPPAGFTGMPRLTCRMGARLQGFPDDWAIWGRKTACWRQIGNALPPAVARAVGTAIAQACNAR